jgi:hypothetical protein
MQSACFNARILPLAKTSKANNKKLLEPFDK